MKELDFLPQSYIVAQRRRRQTRHNIFMSVGLALSLASLHALNVTKIRSAEASLSSLVNGSGGWQSAHDQLTRLESKKIFYRQRAGLLSKLEDAAPLDAVIGEITRLMNDSMALKSLTIEAQPQTPTPTPPGQPAAPDAAGTALPPPGPTRAILTGAAVNEMDVGIFVGKLGSCPLFTEVAPPASHAKAISGRLMTEFEIKFTLRPVEGTP